MAAVSNSRTLSALVALACLAGCISRGAPVVAERTPPVAEPPPRTEVHAPIIPDPGPDPLASKPKIHIPSLEQSVPAAESRRAMQQRQAAARTRHEVKEPPRETQPRSNPRTAAEYKVREGDTLYSIARRHGLDPAGFGRVNDLGASFVIYPGQTLRLEDAGGGQVARESPRPAIEKPKATQPPVAKSPPPQRRVAQEQPKPRSKASAAKWIWPVSGKPAVGFGGGNPGLDYTINAPQSIVSAGAGVVVYAGAGIGGYAQLVIVKHSEALLSAYSFNGETRVKEQQDVKAGDALADINPRGRSSQRMHFEIRRNGEPVNPGSVIRR